MNELCFDELCFDEIGNIENSEEKEKFEVTADNIGWTLRKYAELQKEKQTIHSTASFEVDRIKAWEKKETDTVNESIVFFENLVNEYMQENDLKKIKNPYGTISYRKQQPKWVYDNNLADILEKMELNKYLRVKKEVDKTLLKKECKVVENKICTSDGELIQGVEIQQQEPKLTIKAVE